MNITSKSSVAYPDPTANPPPVNQQSVSVTNGRGQRVLFVAACVKTAGDIVVLIIRFLT